MKVIDWARSLFRRKNEIQLSQEAKKRIADEIQLRFKNVIMEIAAVADQHDIFVPDMTVQVGLVKIGLTFKRLEANDPAVVKPTDTTGKPNV